LDQPLQLIIWEWACHLQDCECKARQFVVTGGDFRFYLWSIVGVDSLHKCLVNTRKEPTRLRNCCIFDHGVNLPLWRRWSSATVASESDQFVGFRLSLLEA
jgi:hypothetical protein